MNTKQADEILREVKKLREQVERLTEVQKEDVMINFTELNRTVFPQWKRQTIYNKCHAGEIPHIRVGKRLLFNKRECIEWRNEQIKRRVIKASPAQVEDIMKFKNAVV